MTQRQFGDLLDLHENTMRRWEAGGMPVGRIRLLKNRLPIKQNQHDTEAALSPESEAAAKLLRIAKLASGDREKMAALLAIIQESCEQTLSIVLEKYPREIAGLLLDDEGKK